MKTVYVRNVPDDVYRGFKSRLALDGLSVADAAIMLFREYAKRGK